MEVAVMVPISLQLYSLRERSKTDFTGVIKDVAAMGYAGVEPAGFYNLGPKAFRRVVEEEGMVVSSSHGPWASPDNLQEVIDTAGVLGVSLVSSGFGPERFATRDEIGRTAETVNGMAEKLRAAGLSLFMHNHWWEFEKLDGVLKYELFAELAPTVLFEIDTYWSANFGANDPAAMVGRFAARAPLLHVKDGPLVKDKPHVALGRGRMPLERVVKAANPAVLRWLVVELDECGTDMTTAVRESSRYLMKKGLGAGRF
jgi:sugar phosphate isomerase/epimerase